MSAVTLWGFQENFYLVNQGEVQNATLFRPVVEKVLMEDMLMKDKELDFQDYIMDLLSAEKIFNIKDKKIVVDAINYFIENRLKIDSELKDSIKDKSIKFLEELKEKINNINENLKYFVINADSRDEHVRKWVEKWDDTVLTPNGLGRFNQGGYIIQDITKIDKYLTHFVIIKDNDVELIRNNEFDLKID